MEGMNDELMDQFGGAEGGAGGGGTGPNGEVGIAVTEEERDAIDRLVGMGFDRDVVIQSYFACDKNEELTAN